MPINNLKRSLSYILIALIFSACQRVTLTTEISATHTLDTSINESVVDIDIDPSEVDNAEQNQDEFVENEAIMDNEETSTLPTPEYTPTPDLRLSPEQWQQWPIIPEVSPNTIDIYQRGITLGNNPQRFSKIGDCQMVKAVMGIYDLPNRYTLREENEYLQGTIDNFAGSFDRDGMAVKGGFNAATVLSPIWADPESTNGRP
mgnify:FL=1